MDPPKRSKFRDLLTQLGVANLRGFARDASIGRAQLHRLLTGQPVAPTTIRKVALALRVAPELVRSCTRKVAR